MDYDLGIWHSKKLTGCWSP